VTGEYRLGDVRHITASAARIAQDLAWTPKVSFAEGVTTFSTAPLRGASPSLP
jgi:dTDP-L-rhamnose 4-epimerase